MDATRRAICQQDPFNPLVTTGTQVSCILVISHFFHLVLKPLGQPGPIAQVLAGIVLGPSLLSRFEIIRKFFIQASSADYYRAFAYFSHIIFMFLIGLEMDVHFFRRNLRKATIISCSCVSVCIVFGVAISLYIIYALNVNVSRVAFALVVIIILANSASPIVVRLAAELKFDTSDVGRLAICCSLINEISCILVYSTYISFTSGKKFWNAVLCIFFTVVLIFLNKYLALWVNVRNRGKKYVTNAEVVLILALPIALSLLIEHFNYDSTISCFLMGIMFPREGKTTRTLLHKLAYTVHNFILPIYFGYTGFQFNINVLNSFRSVGIVALMVLLSIGGKIIGTLSACRYLKITRNQGVIIAFILNLKGHADLLLIDVAPRAMAWWTPEIHSLMIIVIVLNTIIAGPVVAFILSKDERFFAHKDTSLEYHDPNSELRMLACVYNPRPISAIIGLISALSGSRPSSVTPYLIHLVELPKKHKKTSLMYHQLEDGDQYSDEEEYGGNDVLEINDSVDNFTTETRVSISQKKTVSSFESMYEDVCNYAEDWRVSIIFLPFHKHQRIDGKMENGKEGTRTNNQKVLRHAPCSVGILVDRGQSGLQQVNSQAIQHVAILFFGGPDDREALACSRRMVPHPHINLTVIRFKSASTSREENSWIDDASHNDDEVLMDISGRETENQRDNAFVEEFYNRYVTSGQAGYVERYVNDGAQTATALRDIGDMYSLFIVGKGGRGHCPMTTGMSDWEECPELGTVGDLLVSSDFEIHGSVLVIQQHRHSKRQTLADY